MAGDAITHLSGTIDLAVGDVAFLAVTAALFLVGRLADRLEVRAEAAYPGPLE